MKSEIKGIIQNAELGLPIEDVEISVFDRANNFLGEIRSNSKGLWEMNDMTNAFVVHFVHQNYVPKKIQVSELPQKVRLLENKLIGYQNKLWYLPGETVSVYIHSPSGFKARLCRHGYNKKVALDLGSFDERAQNIPDGTFVEQGLDWKESLKYTIPEDCKPGIYSLLIEDGNSKFAIPMVLSSPIATQGPKSKLLVLASTNTWQSYNLWGGRSRYRNFEEALSKNYIKLTVKSKLKSFIVNWISPKLKNRIKKSLNIKNSSPQWMYKRLSIRRPFNNCALEDDFVAKPFVNHLAAGEWRLLAWLERENIEYDIISGAELHLNGDVLSQYKGVLLSTHCEYWTKEMYNSLKHYHQNNGLWIFNISGNSIYREIEFFKDGSTRCVSLAFGSSVEDESQILGVRFSETDYGTCAPFKIIDGNHWAFENILINKKSPYFGTHSLNHNAPKAYSQYDPGRPGLIGGLEGFGASGWETDKVTSTAPKDIEIIAKGMNKNGGADMIVREPKDSRGGLFSASSLTFGGCLLIDEIASKLVINIFKKATVK